MSVHSIIIPLLTKEGLGEVVGWVSEKIIAFIIRSANLNQTYKNC